MRVIGSAAAALLLCASPPAGAAARAQEGAEPSSPLIDDNLPPLPGVDLDWPDPSAPVDVPLAPEAGAAAPLAGENQTPAAREAPPSGTLPLSGFYRVEVQGAEGEGLDGVTTLFRSLSSLERNVGEATNTAQIDRRVEEDLRLLESILVSRGYYDAHIRSRIEPPQASGERATVLLRVEPGERYRFSEVLLTGIDPIAEPEIRSKLPLKAGDPVDAATVQAAQRAFQLALPNAGYAFAKVADPDIVVDRSAHSATLALAVDSGPSAVFGDIRIQGKKLFGPRHVSLISRFRPGEPYNQADLDDLRRALIATGLVASVDLTPIPAGTDREGRTIVDLGVRLSEAPLRTIAGTIGYGTGQGARAEISWQHRNLLPPEGAVTFRGVVGTREQLLGAELRRSNWKRRDQLLNARIAAQHQNLNAYDARTFAVGASIERQTNIIWQKTWTYSLGADLLASDERDTEAETGLSRRRTFFIAALPGRLGYDGSDDLLDPHRGYRLSARLSPEASLQGSAFTYARAQVDASVYLPLGSDNHVLAARVRAGSIVGAARDRIAPSRRFYAGGGGSVRGFSYQGIGPKDISGDPIGGRSLAEAAVEARIRFGAFGLVPFLDAGQLYTTTYPTFSGMRYGGGLGIRYYSSFGPIRVDVGTPIDRQPGESRLAVYVSLGQAF